MVLLRQYIPKSSDFLEYTDEQMKEIEIKLNKRPRKRYQFENAIPVVEKTLFNQKVGFVALFSISNRNKYKLGKSGGK